MTEKFKKTTNAFNYYYERILKPNEIVMVKIPTVTPNARGINDIGYTCSSIVDVYVTIEHNFEHDDTQWQKIITGEDINKTSSAIKFKNTSNVDEARIIMRIIMN